MFTLIRKVFAPGTESRQWLTGCDPQERPSRAAKRRKAKRLRSRTTLGVEPLETRVAPAATPIVISKDALGLDYIGSMAVSPDGQKVYLGRRYSQDQSREDLAVLTLDSSGNPVGQVAFYADNTSPLPFGDRANVQQIMVDAARHKLYLLSDQQLLATGGNDNGTLTVYDLDSSWNPIGSPQSIVVPAAAKRVDAVAVDPTLNLLYVAGYGDSKVFVYNLDTLTAAPQSYAVSAIGATELVVSADGTRMYLDAPSNSTTPSLEVVNLLNGVPQVSSRQFFPVTPPPNSSILFDFSYSPQAIYWRQDNYYGNFGGILPQSAPVWMWQLGTNGNPVGTPQELAQLSGRSAVADPARATLWVAADDNFTDAFTSGSVIDGTAAVATVLDSTGSPIGPGVASATSYGQQGLLMALTGDGRPVVLTEAIPRGVPGNQVKDYRLQVTVQEADVNAGSQPLPATFPVWLYSSKRGLGYAPHNVSLGQPSDAFVLDTDLKGVAGQHALFVGAGTFASTTTTFSALTMRLDVYQGDPNAGGTLLKSLTETVQGENVAILLPGYGFEPPGQRLGQIETMSQHAQTYLSAAQAVALNPEDRPQQFVIGSDALTGGQADQAQLEAEAQAVSLLGINTVQAYLWRGYSGKTGLDPASQINSTLDDNGLARRSLALTFPTFASSTLPLVGGLPQQLPAWFDFSLTPSALDAWVASAVTLATLEGASPAAVVEIHMADEPAWNFPLMLNEVKDVTNHPGWLTAFQTYLQDIGAQQGLHANDFDASVGPDDWGRLSPAGASAALPADASIEARRLFYWTMRFFVDSSAQAFERARVALQAAFPNLRTVYANWPAVYWLSTWYNNGNATAPATPNDNASGAPDWLESGRLGSASPWTEDGFAIPDQQAEQWSTISDALRSASMLTWQATGGANVDPNNPGNFPSDAWQNLGAYIKPIKFGGFPSGASYKILSLLGHGGKSVDLWQFGPSAVTSDPTDGWSERTDVYAPIADALRLVGHAEPVLYPGRPQRGNVAVLLPGTSNLWDPVNGTKLYQQEVWGLDYALVHAGYTVDFVDDTDLASGALSSRGYSALYLTGPNLSAAAQSAVKDWVAGGGTLVVTPGAATADEYNAPTSILDAVLGLQPRTAVRSLAVPFTGIDSLTLTGGSAAAAFGTGSMGLWGTTSALTPAAGGASIEGTLKSGAAGLTLNHYGTGIAIAYGFFPGWQYWLSPSLESNSTVTALPRLPQDWGQEQRQLADAPAVLANTPRPVTVSQPVVEADRLQSDKGIAITLLNWSGQPISSLTVTIPNAGNFTIVCTAQGVPVQTQVNGTTLQVTLPLDHVDVLMLQDSGATATLDGTSGDDQFVITPTGVQLNGQTVLSGPYSNLTLNGLGGNDTFTVLGTPAGSHVTLYGGGGNNTYHIGGDPQFGGPETLDAVLGSITIDGHAGLNALTIDDSAGTAGRTYTVSDSMVAWDGGSVDFANVGTVVVQAGGGNDTFLVQQPPAGLNTPPAPSVTLDGGGGSNRVVGPNSGYNQWMLTGLNAGALNNVTFSSVQNLTGGSNTDFFQFSPGAGVDGQIDGGTGVATLDYSQYGSGVQVNLAGGLATGTGTVTNIHTVIGSAGNDVITGNLVADTLIYGNGGTDQLRGVGFGQTTFVLASTNQDGTAVTGGAGPSTLIGPQDIDNTWSITGPNAGTVNGVVTFSAIDNLTGGDFDDTFKFQTGGSITGVLDGGAGVNTVDYSAFPGNILVDLALGRATLVGFGIERIQNVIGSLGNAILVGDGSGNQLTGGQGRNILIAGASAATLTGGPDDDILVGGNTAYDTNLTALNALMAEWSRNLPYATRVRHILHGGGLNGTVLLNPSTFTANAGGNTLTGAAGIDLFFGSLALDTNDWNPSLGEVFVGPNGVEARIQITVSGLGGRDLLLDGTQRLSDSSSQLLTLIAGSHTLSDFALGTSVSFTVSETGAVSYDTALEGVLTGAGTSTLTLQGRTITIDTRRLSIPELSLNNDLIVTNTAPFVLSGLPGSYTLADNAGTGNSVSFSLMPRGSVSYAAKFQGILTGNGSSTLTVLGRTITIDTRRLSIPSLVLNNTLVVTNTAPFVFTGLPGTQTLSDNAGSHASVQFTLALDGSISYAAKLQGILSGNGTRALTVLGRTIQIDATALNGRNIPSFQILGVGSFSTSQIQTVTLLPGPATFQDATSEFAFTVTLSGTVDYAHILDGQLGGRGTRRLVLL
jgi:hypothetical protein